MYHLKPMLSHPPSQVDSQHHRLGRRCGQLVRWSDFAVYKWTDSFASIDPKQCQKSYIEKRASTSLNSCVVPTESSWHGFPKTCSWWGSMNFYSLQGGSVISKQKEIQHVNRPYLTHRTYSIVIQFLVPKEARSTFCRGLGCLCAHWTRLHTVAVVFTRTYLYINPEERTVDKPKCALK